MAGLPTPLVVAVVAAVLGPKEPTQLVGRRARLAGLLPAALTAVGHPAALEAVVVATVVRVVQPEDLRHGAAPVVAVQERLLVAPVVHRFGVVVAAADRPILLSARAAYRTWAVLAVLAA